MDFFFFFLGKKKQPTPVFVTKILGGGKKWKMIILADTGKENLTKAGKIRWE